MHQQGNPHTVLGLQAGGAPTKSIGKASQDRVAELKKNFEWPKTFNRTFSSMAELSMGKQLGKGGFSQVFKATGKRDSKVYAVKRVALRDGRSTSSR